MATALVIGGRPDYAGPAVRILPRTGARVYLSERWKVDDLINNNDQQQQLKIWSTIRLRWNRAKRSDLICVRYEGPIDFFYQSF